MNKKTSLRDRIIAYKLETQVHIDGILFAVFVMSAVLYFIPTVRNSNILSNLVLALFTSVLVSVITISVDIYVEYKRRKNDVYLESLREFGINNLYLEKESILIELLDKCIKMIWISGYRLILTNKLKKDIQNAILRGADFNAVICPPWSLAFQMVYGTNEKVLDNYFEVFYAVNQARKEAGKDKCKVNVSFVDKPIFSDTYRIDQHYLTGPYMHNKDKVYNLLMAKDFFSYEIAKKTPLCELVHDEYVTLYREAESDLDWDKFEQEYEANKNGDLRESEKSEALRRACVPHADNIDIK